MPMSKTLHEVVEEALGVNVELQEDVQSIGTSATKILSNQPNRMALTMINLSANTIYIAFSNQVSSNRGIILDGNGGTVSFNWRDDLEIMAHEFWAVASAASSNLFVFEEVGI